MQFSMNSQGFPRRDKHGQHTPAVGNVKLALPENIALLLHPHVDVPWSLVVTYPDFGWQIVSP